MKEMMIEERDYLLEEIQFEIKKIKSLVPNDFTKDVLEQAYKQLRSLDMRSILDDLLVWLGQEIKEHTRTSNSERSIGYISSLKTISTNLNTLLTIEGDNQEGYYRAFFSWARSVLDNNSFVVDAYDSGYKKGFLTTKDKAEDLGLCNLLGEE